MTLLTLQHYYEQLIVFTSDLIEGLFNKNPSKTLQHYYEQLIVFTSDLIEGLFNKNPSKIELVGLWRSITTPHTKDQFNKSLRH